MRLYDAARRGDEQAVQELLATGAAADAAGADGRLPIHVAAEGGHVGVVRLLMQAAQSTIAAADGSGWTALHHAASHGHTAVVQMLMAAAPATVTAVSERGLAPLHCAARYGHTAVVNLLVEAAPDTATAVDHSGFCVLDHALFPAANLETARCLVRASPTVQPTLGSLVRQGLAAATLYADLVSRLALTQQEWQSIPAPCPQLVRVLPAVMDRSVEEAGWLVGRLGQIRRARLRTATLCISRVVAGLEGAPPLPPDLSQRILVAALEHP